MWCLNLLFSQLGQTFFIEGIPRLVWSGEEGNYNVMVLELLGPSLQDLFEYSGKRFPLCILLALAKQMVTASLYIFSRKLYHNKLKIDLSNSIFTQ